MNRDALVVGINRYPWLKDTRGEAKHLNTPASDAEAIALRLEEYGGFRVRRLPESIQEEQRRVDPKKLVQGYALYEAIIQLFNPIGDSVPQTALLYFAGHGLRRNLGGVTEGFLATSDSDPRKNQWGVSLRWLRELLQKSPIQQQMVWLDCCYSGELLNFAEADLGTAGQGRTRFFIAAAREFESAEENIQGQHGVFSQVLWEGLDPKRQPEGVVNNDRLIEYIDQTLKGTPQQPIWYNPNCEILLTGAREEVFVLTPDGVCPYKGLRFFDVEDAPYFYGREALTQKLIERVQVGKGNFLAVLGVSGSGKSSVLRAGLMYQLQQERRLPGTEQWKIRIFTPGEQPLVSLATAFLDEEVTDIERAGQLKTAEEAIAQGATGLARLIRASKSPRTVLIVDQFEEVFTVCQSQAERQQFISGLLGALKQTGDKLCLIFAMRDDFLGKCAAYPELADLIQVNLVMVTPMNTQELRQAIVEPAKKLGRKVEENLIDAILKDLGVEVEQQTREPEPGMLPLLSYTLEQLWQRQTLNWLKLDSYNQLGGVQKTLENLAEQTYKQLSIEEQRVADQIFIKLTHLGEGVPDTRKQVPQQDLVTHVQSADLVDRVIQKLAQAKLIVTSEQRKGQEKVAVVDVAHEALIRHWSWLRELLDNNREAIRTERKIQTAAEEWRDQEKPTDYLLTGLRLAEAEKFLQNEAAIVPLSSLVKEFIEESRKERDRLINEAEERRQLERKQFKQAIEGEIKALASEAEARFLAYDQLGALLVAVKAQTKLQQVTREKLVEVDDTVRIQTERSLQRTVYNIQERNRLQGHTADVWSISFSTDGNTLASCSTDSTVRLWNQDGVLLKIFPDKPEGGWFTDLSFSSDGQSLVSVRADGTVYWWVLEDGHLLKYWEQKSHLPFIWSLSLSQDDRFVALAGEQGAVIYDSDGNLLKEVPYIHGKTTTSICFSHHDQIIASGGEDGTIKIWNCDSSLLRTLLHGAKVTSVCFSHDDQLIASGGEDNTIKIWTLDNSFTTLFHGAKVTSVCFSHDDQLVASGGEDSTIKIWTLDGSLIKVFQGHRNTVTSINFSHDDKVIASASRDNTLRIWALARGTLLKTLPGHTDGVRSVSFSSDGKILASTSEDRTIRLWNSNGTWLKTLQEHRGAVSSLSFCPNTNKPFFASGSFNDRREFDAIILWNLDGTLLKGIWHPGIVTSVCISPDGRRLATTGWDCVIRLWDIDRILSLHGLDGYWLVNLDEDRKLGKHELPVNSVCFSPNSKFLASASDDCTIKLWSLDENVPPKVLSGHRELVYSVSFSPNGEVLASASWDRTIKLWSCDGSLLKTLEGHDDWVTSVCFSPDNQRLVSGSKDRTVRIWSRNGTLLRTLEDHRNIVWGVCFSPDSQIIASASQDNTIKLWKAETLTSEELLVHGCSWLHDYLKTNPNITEEERHLCDGVATNN